MKRKKLLNSKNDINSFSKKTTVKFRITFWFCCILSIAFICISDIVLLCTDEIAKGFALEMVEETVENVCGDVMVNTVDGKTEITLKEQHSQEIFITVFSEDGKILYSERSFPSMSYMPDMDGDTNTFKNSDGKIMMTYDKYLKVKDYGNVWVRGIGTSEQISSMVKTFMIFTVCSFPFIVLLVAVLGYLFIEKAFSPVDQIRQSAEQIAENGDMSKKIDISFISANPNDEVLRLKQTFDKMLSKLNSAAERDKQFTSDVSHELRTPVAVIISQCETALKNKNIDAASLKTINSIYEEAQSMSAMIKQLLMLAKADSGTQSLCFENIDICGIADAVCDQLSETAAQKNIHFHRNYDDKIIVTADEMLIMRLFINLIQNAINYGKTDGNIWVSIAADKECIIKITDDGTGILPEELPKIFDRFYHTSTSQVQGSGLGLSIVKWIVTAHNGSIDVKSEPNRFSEFTVKLPLKR